MQYIKVKKKNIVDGVIVFRTGKKFSKFLKKSKLNIAPEDLINEKLLSYDDKKGNKYFLLRVFDLDNLCRQEIPTEKEEKELRKFVKALGFKVLNKLPPDLTQTPV